MNPRISVVVAARDSGARTTNALRAIQTEVQGLTAELIVVAPAGSSEARQASLLGRVLTVEGDPSAPELWRVGIVASHGELVVTTVSGCTPSPGWLAALIGALGPDAAAAGGSFRLGSRRATVAAVYFLRYSPYQLPFDRHDADEVPGDNAVYRRSAIDAVAGSWRDGFWENEVNVALRTRGERLQLDPRPVTTLVTAGGFFVFCRQRFRHGVRFGEWRGGRWRALLAPVGMARFLLRITSRVRPGDRGLYLQSLVVLKLYLVCWTAGEVVGLLRGRR
ncbi:MAG: hypothetical protein U0556_02620 [Dehalococcoidia bacterium]